MTCVAKLLLAPLILLAACNSTRTWTDGFSLAFHRPGTSLLALRYAEEEQWHEAQAISVKEPKLAQCIVSFDNAEESECWETEEVNMNFFQGVGLAREIGGARSVLGYTNKNILFIHAGVGLVFGESPDLTLREVASSAPSIVHIADSEWLVAFQDMTGRLHIRRYTYGRPPVRLLIRDPEC